MLILWALLQHLNKTFSQKCVILLDFSNIISESVVKQLAEADDQEVVREVQVYIYI